MEQLNDKAVVKKMLRLLEENGRQEEAKEFANLITAVDSMERQYNDVLAELQAMKRQLTQATEQRHPVKDILAKAAISAEQCLDSLNHELFMVREQIVSRAANAVSDFKRMGISALERAVSSLHVFDVLTSMQDNLLMSADDVSETIRKAKDMGRELRSAGAHLKNAGRAASGKDCQNVGGGQEGRFQAAVLAPLRKLHSVLVEASRVAQSARGAVVRLEKAAEKNRGKRERPSVRHRLEQASAPRTPSVSARKPHEVER